MGLKPYAAKIDSRQDYSIVNLDERISTRGELESGSMGISDMAFITKIFNSYCT